MSDYREMLENAREEFPSPELPFEGVRRRADIRHRNARIRAGAIGVTILLAIGFALLRVYQLAPEPARPPQPPAAPANELAPTVVGLDGRIDGPIRGLPADAWQATVSPDGSQIAYVTRSLAVGACGNCWPGARVVVVGVDGTGSRYLTSIGSLPQSVAMPAWSPDGSEIAYVNTVRGNEDIYVMDAFGGHVRRLTTSPAQDEFPTWSPDGTTIAFDSSPTQLDTSGLSPNQEIWTVPATGGAPRRLTHNHVPDQAPSYSPDGTRLAFSHNVQIAVMPADGGFLRTIGPGWSPRWSPQGSRIAFLDFTGPRGDAQDPTSPSCTPSCPLGTVMVVDATGGTPTSLGVLVPSSLNPVSWQPSGQAVLADSFTGPVIGG